ncbi:MAG: acyl-CoA thioesterase [Gammaproteobacteria bacterium]|nr:acyl-CoA thioesterase [Gammaproteobacteria bacterium]
MADPQESRDRFPYFATIPTRWMDNDVYGHVNNVVYYSYVDTVANRYLIDNGVLDIHGGEVIGVAVESQCRYLQAIAFPDIIDAGLRVAHIGNSSVRYEIGLFKAGDDDPVALAHFVHVFVNRESRKPVPIPANLRLVLEQISV